MKIIYSALTLVVLLFIIWATGNRIDNDGQPTKVESQTDQIEHIETKKNYEVNEVIDDNPFQKKPEVELKSDSTDEVNNEDSFLILSEISFFRQASFKEVFYREKFIGLSIISDDSEFEISDFGLIQGDLITHVEEEVISNLEDFKKKIIASRSYETALVTINRNNTLIDIDIAIE